MRGFRNVIDAHVYQITERLTKSIWCGIVCWVLPKVAIPPCLILGLVAMTPTVLLKSALLYFWSNFMVLLFGHIDQMWSWNIRPFLAPVSKINGKMGAGQSSDKACFDQKYKGPTDIGQSSSRWSHQGIYGSSRWPQTTKATEKEMEDKIRRKGLEATLSTMAINVLNLMAAKDKAHTARNSVV